METTPAIDKAVDFFDAYTVELYPDVRFYNATEEEFMKARTDRVSNRFQPLIDRKLMGVRHAENGWLYAIVENTDNDADEGDKTREVPVGALPFADVQVGPDCEFGRRSPRWLWRLDRTRTARPTSCFRHNTKGRG